ncbi:MAG: OsmC family protein [Verrucomicrobiales bacterium]
MPKFEIKYLGDLRCTATHLPSGSLIETDAPVDNEGKGERFSPTDLVGAALGTCMATIMGILARRKGIALEGMRIGVEKTMSTTAPRRISKLKVHIHLPLPPDHAERSTLERGALSCPVHHSLHPDIDSPVVFHYEG